MRNYAIDDLQTSPGFREAGYEKSRENTRGTKHTMDLQMTSETRDVSCVVRDIS